MTQWYVKDLSKLTDISVQTLHHYDRINLLEPSLRLANGYRVYTERDLLKLQQLIALKFFGFELSQIKTLLSDERDELSHFNRQASPRRIRSYLHRWGTWWVRTAETWGYQDLLVWFLEVCRDPVPAAYAAGLYWHDVKKSQIEANHDRHPVFELDLPAAA